MSEEEEAEELRKRGERSRLQGNTMQDNGRRDAYEVENMVEEDETFEQHRASIK